MKGDYFPGLSRKKTSRDHDPLQKILEDWHGKSAGAKEIQSRLPKTVSVSEGVDEALKQLLTPELALIQKIQRLWIDIAGKALSRVLQPSHIKNGTLYIEVSHPAYMMTFGKQESEMLISKIDKVVGKRKCLRISLIPVGGISRTKSRSAQTKNKE
jgi:hypothetical protein